MNIKQILEETDTRAGRLFDVAIQGLIVVSLISFSIETLPSISPAARRVLSSIETVTITIFTIEYIARVAVADNRFRFVTSFYGMVDLLAILPFYIASGIDLRALRVFRMLRIVRMLKLVRYSRALKRFHVAFLLAKEELILYGWMTIALIYLAGVGIYYFENEAQPEQFASIFHSLWWAVATLTTVGYGDVYPVTPGGRFFTFIILMIGLGIIAIPAGLIASALSRARAMEDD